jgi:hypothetical protein
LDAFYGSDKAGSARYHHPGLEWVGTKLSYCNGKIQPGSSNITPYMVWAYAIVPCIAQTLHLVRSFGLEWEEEVGEPREQDKASSSR